MVRNRLSNQPIVHCVLCNARIKFRGDIDFNKYNGQVCCDKCDTLLGIVISKNKLQGLKVVEKGFKKLSPKDLIKMANLVEEQRKKMFNKPVEELEAEIAKLIPPGLSKSDSGKGQT